MLPALLLPTLILTWQAHSFVPSDYPGKVLPPRDSTVDAYLEMVDGGKITPLAKNIIRWEVNDKFLSGGANMNRVSFPLDRFTTRAYIVKATVKDINGQDLSKTVFIDRADPVITLEADPAEKSTEGTHLNITARPFFFSLSNPNDLLFSWLVNGVAAPSKTSSVNLLVPASAIEQEVSIKVSAVNRANTLETAEKNSRLIIN